MVLSFIKRILTCTFLFFFGVIFFLMIFRMPTVIFIAYVALASVLVNRIGQEFIIFIILGSFLIRLAYISIITTPLESDFKLLYDAAVLFSPGRLQLQPAGLFSGVGLPNRLCDISGNGCPSFPGSRASLP